MFASFECDWSAKAYLDDYYSFVEQDERETLRFLVEAFQEIENQPIALEFGCGPMIAHLLPLVPYVSEIHVADFLAVNLDEIRQWQSCQLDAHNWHSFTEAVLEQEGVECSVRAIEAREPALRTKITDHLEADAALSIPLLAGSRGYEFLLSCYCADSATSQKQEWSTYMQNIMSLLNPGGYFVGAALRLCHSYKVKELSFPCANVHEDDFEELFQSLQFERTRVEVRQVPEHKPQGYDSILLVSGYKPLNTS